MISTDDGHIDKILPRKKKLSAFETDPNSKKKKLKAVFYKPGFLASGFWGD